MTPGDSSRSRAWKENPHPRYWWHRLAGADYVPPVYSDLNESEWAVLREWYDETDRSGPIGECAVPLISCCTGSSWGIALGVSPNSEHAPVTLLCFSVGCFAA